MTSRERMVLAMNHQEPDRVPMGGRLTIGVYRRVREYFGLDLPEWPPMSWATEVHTPPAMVEALGWDYVDVRAGTPDHGPAALEGPATPTCSDEWGVEFVKVDLPTGGFYYEMSHHPLRDASVEDLARYPWPDPEDPGRIRGLAEHARMLRETTDLAVIGMFAPCVFEQAWYMRGLEPMLSDLILDPEFAETLLDRINDIQIDINVRCIEAAGKYIDAVYVADDLGSQTGPLFSVAIFDRFIKPRLAKRCRAIRGALATTNPDAKIFYHTCGDAYPFLSGLIEAGIDFIDPVQLTAAQMEARRLKEEFGSRLGFHGAVDTQWVLPFGSPTDTRRETKQRIEELAKGGGFIAGPVHAVQNDVSVGNLLAMAAAVREYGRYGSRVW